MFKRVIAVISGLLFFCSVAVSAANIKIQHWTSDHGAHVYFVKTSVLPMVDVRVVFAAGSAYDGAHFGLAALTNNMFGETTKSLSANQIANKFDAVGAVFGNDIDRDMASLSIRSLVAAKYLTPALITFKDVLANAVFNETSFERVKSQTLAGIKVGQESPDTVAMDKFTQALYGDQAYAHPVAGTLQSVTALTIPMLKEFYDRYYVAHNADIILVGDLSRSHAQSIANELSSALPSGEHAATLPMMKPATADKALHVNFPSQQTTIVLGQLGITRKNPDYFPLVVGNSILGQLPMTSLLFKNVRNKRGLAYYAVSGFDLLRYKGPFEVQLKTRAAKSGESIDVVRSTLADFIKDGPTSQQLTMAKNYINGSFPLSFATNSAILGVVTNIAFYKRPLDFMGTYLKYVNAVTTDQIKSAFEKVLHPNKMILVTVGPNEKG